MSTKHLLESTKITAPTVNADGTWKVRLISEGRGSSGVYSADLLESYHTVFDNSLSFTTHPEKGDPTSRNFTQIVGRVVGETWIEKDEAGLVGVYANYKPDPAYKERLEEYKDVLGLSIFIEGDGREAENGDFLVESFNGDDPYKSVDVVIAAGRGGRFEESLRKMYIDRLEESADDKTGAASAQDPNQKEQHMTPEQLEQLIESVTAAVTAKLPEASAEDKQEKLTVEQAIAAYDEKIQAIDDANLLKSQAESLRKRAAAGEDITEALEEAKKIRDEAAAAVQAESKSVVVGGRTLGESAGYEGATAWKGRR